MPLLPVFYICYYLFGKEEADQIRVQISMCFIQLNIMFFIFFFRAGGPWLITDLDRIESIFVINPNLQVTYNVFLFA